MKLYELYMSTGGGPLESIGKHRKPSDSIISISYIHPYSFPYFSISLKTEFSEYNHQAQGEISNLNEKRNLRFGDFFFMKIRFQEGPFRNFASKVDP